MLCYNITIDQVFIPVLFKPIHLVFEKFAFKNPDTLTFYSGDQAPTL